MEEILMCDQITRVWCCRIGLVFSVFGVLSMMLFQIWNYYFSLVQQMDNMSIEYPRIHTMLSLCARQKIASWNIADCQLGSEHWTCTLDNKIENPYIVEGTHDFILNASHIQITPVDICENIKIWILPW